MGNDKNNNDSLSRANLAVSGIFGAIKGLAGAGHGVAGAIEEAERSHPEVFKRAVTDTAAQSRPDHQQSDLAPKRSIVPPVRPPEL